ncbi:sure-like protein [Sistotremastrum niveocremeum HHB9708]|uniref:Sure-like protein n=1 Tax=Sistotremastrum niveocremeum HHB9708 TaxID=1314777 RepID=A0A164WNV0_9AGAM|nr:sure-like protein [Sistotremastrum niveocremeum HHB9708]
MRSFKSLVLILGALISVSNAINVVSTNDDGWAEQNIRVLFNDLVAAGYNVVLSAPALDKSGTGSSDAPATTLASACEFNSCPKGSPAEGSDASNSRLNYVNSFPVTSVRFGIQTLSPQFFGGPPDIVVSGPNVGANLGSTTQISGTVGAACEAVKEGIPAIAFSGSTGSQIGFTAAAPSPNYPSIYATLSTTITNTLTSTAKPFLPAGIFLNVNFPSTSSCTSASKFSFVLSRINSASSGTPADVSTCGTTRLPTESSVVGTKGCFVSISVGNATTKDDATAASQATVLSKLSSLLSCI